MLPSHDHQIIIKGKTIPSWKDAIVLFLLEKECKIYLFLNPLGMTRKDTKRMFLCFLRKKADYIITVWHLWVGNVVMSNPTILKNTLHFYFIIINKKIIKIQKVSKFLFKTREREITKSVNIINNKKKITIK